MSALFRLLQETQKRGVARGLEGGISLQAMREGPKLVLVSKRAITGSNYDDIQFEYSATGTSATANTAAKPGTRLPVDRSHEHALRQTRDV